MFVPAAETNFRRLADELIDDVTAEVRSDWLSVDFDLPAAADGSRVFYEVTAIDESGVSASVSATVTRASGSNIRLLRFERVGERWLFAGVAG